MADGRVIIDTELNTKNAEKEASGLGAKIKGGLSGGLKAGAKITAGAIASVGASAVATGGALIKMAKSTAETGDHIDKMSQKMGMSAEAYQKWDYVAKISGTSIDGLKMGFKTLTNTIDSANKGNEKAVAKFQAVGISMDDLKNKSREQIFEDTIKGLQNVTDETERSALANQLLGRAGMELGPMLNSTNGDIDKLMKTAEDYGMIMSDKAVKASAKFQDSVTTMQGTLTGLKNRMTAEFLPALTQVTDGLALVFKGDTEEGMKKIDEGINGLIDNITNALPKLLQVGGGILQSIGTAIIKNLPSIVNTGVKVIQSLITGILNAIPLVLQAIPQIIQSLLNGLSTILTTIVSKAPEIAQSILTTLQEVVPILVEQLPTLIQQMIDAFFSNLGMFADMLPQLVEMAVNLIVGLADAIVNAIPIIIDKLPEIIQKIIDALIQSLPTLINGVIQLVIGIVKALPKIIISLVKALPKIIVSIVNGLIKALPLLIKGAITLVIELVKNLPTIILELIKAIPTIILELIKAFIEGVPKMVEGLIKFVKMVVTQGPKIVASLFKKIPSFILKIIKQFGKMGQQMLTVGKNIVTGIWDGIKNASKWLWDKIKEFCGDIVDGFCDFLGIGSPSKVMRDRVGYWMGEGIYEGFEKSDPMGQINKELDVGMAKLETSASINNALNYQRIGEAVRDGIANSNLGINLDGREVGRIIRSY